MTNTLHMAALLGETVTEGHVAICRERGHATHTVRGADTGTCPRCGIVKTSDPVLESMRARLADPLKHHVSIAEVSRLPRMIREREAKI